MTQWHVFTGLSSILGDWSSVDLVYLAEARVVVRIPGRLGWFAKMAASVPMAKQPLAYSMIVSGHYGQQLRGVGPSD